MAIPTGSFRWWSGCSPSERWSACSMRGWLSVLRVHPLIVTLGMGAILQGVTLLYALGPVGKVPRNFSFLAYGRVAGLPLGATIAVVLCVLVALFLRYLPFGRQIYAVGDDDNAARLAGLPRTRVLMLVYGCSGFCCAATGLYLVARFGVGQPYTGVNYTLASITPVILGGTAAQRRQGRRDRHVARRLSDLAGQQSSQFHGRLETLPAGGAGTDHHPRGLGLRANGGERRERCHDTAACGARSAAARPLRASLSRYGIFLAVACVAPAWRRDFAEPSSAPATSPTCCCRSRRSASSPSARASS